MSPKVLRKQCKQAVNQINHTIKVSNQINYNCFGEYKPELMQIIIFRRSLQKFKSPYSNYGFLYTLLHEIGHALCFTIGFNTQNIYSVYRSNPVKFEKIADIFAIIILKKVNIYRSIDKYHNNYKDRSLLRAMIKGFNHA